MPVKSILHRAASSFTGRIERSNPISSDHPIVLQGPDQNFSFSALRELTIALHEFSLYKKDYEERKHSSDISRKCAPFEYVYPKGLYSTGVINNGGFDFPREKLETNSPRYKYVFFPNLHSMGVGTQNTQVFSFS
jgi:hypothetical protein